MIVAEDGSALPHGKMDRETSPEQHFEIGESSTSNEPDFLEMFLNELEEIPKPGELNWSSASWHPDVIWDFPPFSQALPFDGSSSISISMPSLSQIQVQNRLQKDRQMRILKLHEEELLVKYLQEKMLLSFPPELIGYPKKEVSKPEGFWLTEFQNLHLERYRLQIEQQRLELIMKQEKIEQQKVEVEQQQQRLLQLQTHREELSFEYLMGKLDMNRH